MVAETNCSGVVERRPSPVNVFVSANVVSVASKTPAAARADGTNADPRIPASKPAVVTAVTNLFFIDTIVSS
jgi:hypothetical protein